jgi:hypothetical protein
MFWEMLHAPVGASPKMLNSEIGTIVITSVTLSNGVAVVAEGVTVYVTVTVTTVGGGSRVLVTTEEIPLADVEDAVVETAEEEVLVAKMLVLVELLNVVVVVILAVEYPVPVGPTAKVVLKTGNGGGEMVEVTAAEVVVAAVELLSTNPGPGMGSVAS